MYGSKVSVFGSTGRRFRGNYTAKVTQNGACGRSIPAAYDYTSNCGAARRGKRYKSWPDLIFRAQRVAYELIRRLAQVT